MMHMQSIVKRINFLFLALVLIPFLGIGQNTETPYRIKTIVIDAGHGGKDPGNLGTGRYKAQEKDIALDVVLRVGAYIEKQFPEIKVIYTRNTDVFIGLDGRAEIANDAKADLFISVHCNAFTNPNSNGVETFVLGLHRNKENLQVAMKENSAIFLEDDYKTKYEGFDPNSAESIIALTIMQSAYLQQSLTISSYVQNQFKNRVGRKDRGVKQAGFLVIRKTTMPSILIELGFLTHAPEEDFLNSENGKSYMSSAIFRGFKEYKEMVEDPLPGGVIEEEEGTDLNETPTKVTEEAAKNEALEAVKLAKEKAKQDSITKLSIQARDKLVADSLEQRKQQLLAEKKQREEELANKAEEAKKAKIQAKIDSLEQVKKEKVAAFEKQKADLAAEQEKEAKAAEKARLAQEEKDKKELESKKDAKEWLEEIKEVKQQELADAKRQIEVDAEKEKLEAIKQQKLQELADAKAKADAMEKAKADSVATSQMIKEQLRIDSLAKAKREQEQARQDSISEVRRLKQAAESVTIDAKKAASAEEAELLFLQLRKKQLEHRIEQLKKQNVEPSTRESLVQKPVEVKKDIESQPVIVVNEPAEVGIVLKVQVVSSSNPIAKNSNQFKGKEVWEYQQGGLYKYTVGATVDFEEITKLQSELRDLGFKGAFVVAFKDGERIKVSEARGLLNMTE